MLLRQQTQLYSFQFIKKKNFQHRLPSSARCYCSTTSPKTHDEDEDAAILEKVNARRDAWNRAYIIKFKREYLPPVLYSSSIFYRLKKWTGSQRKYGLRFDDVFQLRRIMHEVFPRLTKKEQEERTHRIQRAVQLYLQRKFLPKEEWPTDTTFSERMMALILAVEEEFIFRQYSNNRGPFEPVRSGVLAQRYPLKAWKRNVYSWW